MGPRSFFLQVPGEVEAGSTWLAADGSGAECSNCNQVYSCSGRETSCSCRNGEVQVRPGVVCARIKHLVILLGLKSPVMWDESSPLSKEDELKNLLPVCILQAADPLRTCRLSPVISSSVQSSSSSPIMCRLSVQQLRVKLSPKFCLQNFPNLSFILWLFCIPSVTCCHHPGSVCRALQCVFTAEVKSSAASK